MIRLPPLDKNEDVKNVSVPIFPTIAHEILNH